MDDSFLLAPPSQRRQHLAQVRNAASSRRSRRLIPSHRFNRFYRVPPFDVPSFSNDTFRVFVVSREPRIDVFQGPELLRLPHVKSHASSKNPLLLQEGILSVAVSGRLVDVFDMDAGCPVARLGGAISSISSSHTFASPTRRAVDSNDIEYPHDPPSPDETVDRYTPQSISTMTRIPGPKPILYCLGSSGAGTIFEPWTSGTLKRVTRRKHFFVRNNFETFLRRPFASHYCPTTKRIIAAGFTERPGVVPLQVFALNGKFVGPLRRRGGGGGGRLPNSSGAQSFDVDGSGICYSVEGIDSASSCRLRRWSLKTGREIDSFRIQSTGNWNSGYFYHDRSSSSQIILSPENRNELVIARAKTVRVYDRRQFSSKHLLLDHSFVTRSGSSRHTIELSHCCDDLFLSLTQSELRLWSVGSLLASKKLLAEVHGLNGAKGVCVERASHRVHEKEEEEERLSWVVGVLMQEWECGAIVRVGMVGFGSVALFWSLIG